MQVYNSQQRDKHDQQRFPEMHSRTPVTHVAGTYECATYSSRLCTCTHVEIRMHAHVREHTHVQAYMQIYNHKHTHAHMQSQTNTRIDLKYNVISALYTDTDRDMQT